MAPRARSTPAVSTAMVSALDALSSILVAEHPRREARGLDRVVGTERGPVDPIDRKSTRLNSSHRCISYAVFCLKKKNKRLSSCRAQLWSRRGGAQPCSG